MLPRRFRCSAPWAPAVRVGLPPIIVLALRNRASHIVTPVTPTGDHGGTSYPQMIRIKSDEASAWGMTLNRSRARLRPHRHNTVRRTPASATSHPTTNTPAAASPSAKPNGLALGALDPLIWVSAGIVSAGRRVAPAVNARPLIRQARRDGLTTAHDARINYRRTHTKEHQ